MNAVQGSLTLLNPHTPNAQVFWKGQPVQNITGLKVYNNVVTLTVPEDPVLAELMANGIKIVRV